MSRPVPWKPLAIVTTTTTILLSLLLLPACCCVRGPAAPTTVPPARIPTIGEGDMPTPTEAAAKAPTEAQMRNVFFHLDPDTSLHIHELRGRLQAKTAGTPLNFDNKLTFVQTIDRGVIGLTGPSLENLMNRYVFGYAGAPLRNLHITVVGKQLRQEGIMHKVVDIPFTMLANVSATPEGRIRIHPTKIDICGINGIGLLKALGQNMQKMLDLSKAKGVRAEKNDLIIDALAILPPPTTVGRITSVAIEGDELVQHFDSGKAVEPLPPPRAGEPNYMYFRGGTLRMGKLLMVDADMQVIDTDPSDPFDFDIDDYNSQLVEGFDRNQPNYGLVVFMRDYADLGKRVNPEERSAEGSPPQK